MTAKITVYRDMNDDWRWRYVASNGKVLADSGEGYGRKRDCLSAMQEVVGGTYEMGFQQRNSQGTMYQQGKVTFDVSTPAALFVEVLP